MTHCSTANVEEGDTRRTQVRRGQTLYFHFQESAFRSKNTPGASAEHSGRPFKQDHEQVKRGDLGGMRSPAEHGGAFANIRASRG